MITMALVLASRVVLYKVETTVTIVASTEGMSFRTSQQHGAGWIVRDAQITGGYDGKPKTFTGEVRLRPGVDCQAERVSVGPFWLNCQPAPGTSGVVDLFANDQMTEAIDERLVLQVGTAGSEGRTGLLLPLEGSVEIGTNITLQQRAASLLKSGRVTMVGTSWLTGSVFDAGQRELFFGDAVHVASSASIGFIAITESPAMTAVFRVLAEEAEASHFGSTGYVISSSAFEKIKNDPFLCQGPPSEAIPMTTTVGSGSQCPCPAARSGRRTGSATGAR